MPIESFRLAWLVASGYFRNLRHRTCRAARQVRCVQPANPDRPETAARHSGYAARGSAFAFPTGITRCTRQSLFRLNDLTDVLARYRLQREPTAALAQLDKHSKADLRAAGAAAAVQYEALLRWLRAVGRIMMLDP